MIAQSTLTLFFILCIYFNYNISLHVDNMTIDHRLLSNDNK